MPSLHKDPRQRSPYFYCKFRNADGRISFKSTKKKKSEEAWNVCLAWTAAARKASAGELTEAQARKVITEIVEKSGGKPISFLSTKDFFGRWLS